MITPDYKAQITKLHATQRWGNQGWKALPEALSLILRYGLKKPSILDFGAGERTLERDAKWALPQAKVTSYDPGIPGIDVLPTGQFDIVICTDVMEHVEPQFVDQTLDVIRALTKHAAYIDIACSPAKTHLPDGRNAHLVVEQPSWWLVKLQSRWGEVEVHKQHKALEVVARV